MACKPLILPVAIAALLMFTVSAHCATVPLTQATATWSQSSGGSYPVSGAIDGNQTSGGWGIYRGTLGAQQPETAVFETVSDIGTVGGTRLTVRMIQEWGTVHTIGRFRLSVTSADRSLFADGLAANGNIGPDSIWTVLKPRSCSSANGATMTLLADDSILVGGATPSTDTYTIMANTNMVRVTGLRLETLHDPSLPYNGPGRHPYGNFVLTELTLDATPSPKGISNRSAHDAIIADTAAYFRFTVWGKVTTNGSSSFTLDDGSGMPVTVVAPGYSGLTNNDYARATGTLQSVAGIATMTSSAAEVSKLQ